MRLVKLLPFCPFKAVVNGVPSCLKRSTRTVTLAVPVLAITISVAQPPPAANSGNSVAPAPPTPRASVGSGPVNAVTVVTGIVLKFTSRNRNPITDIGVVDVRTNAPVNSAGSFGPVEKSDDDWLPNISVT